MKKPIPFGKYLLLERVNVGGMAEVFKAKVYGVEGFERLVAVKRILPSIAEDKEFITMFVDEAKIAVQLTHANIAQIFDLGKVGESYFIAMEFVHGKDLRAIFDRARKRAETVPVPMACYVGMKVCEGLDYAHNKKDAAGGDLRLVHRDVSPQNVLISYDGEVKVIDFGIAKAAGKANKTQAGILKGKFGYMSPEQVRGLPLDRRSDIFAVGIVLYELLTGERLFVGESDFSTLEKVKNVEIMPPSTYNRRIPDELEQIVLKALAKDVEDRYQTAMDLHDDLQSFMYTSGNFFSRKDLSAYQRKAFAEEIAKESAREEEYRRMEAGMPRPSGGGLAQFDDIPGAGPSAAPGRARPAAPAPPPPRPRKPTLMGAAAVPPPPPRGSLAPAPPPLPSRSLPPAPPSPPAMASASLAPAPPVAAAGGIDMDWDEEELSTQIYDKPEFGDVGIPSLPDVAPGPGAPSPFEAALPVGAVAPPIAAAPPPSDPIASAIPVMSAPRSGGAPSPFDAPAPRPSGRESTAVTRSVAGDEKRGGSKAAIIGLAAILVLGVLSIGAYFAFFRSQPGTISVETDPRDALVFLDNSPVSTMMSSPFVLSNVSPGSHILEVRRAGYESWATRLDVASGQSVTVPPVVLVPQSGTVPPSAAGVASTATQPADGVPGAASAALPAAGRAGFALDTDPTGANVFVNDRELPQRTPIRVSDLEPGTYGIRVEHGESYAPWITQITVTDGQILQLETARLTLRRIAVAFTSSPDGAEVFLTRGTERRALGRTPVTADVDVTGEPWTVSMTRAGYEDYEARLTLPEGVSRTSHAATLEERRRAGGAAGARPVARPTTPPPISSGISSRPGSTPTATPPTPVARPSSGGGTGTLSINSVPWSQVIVDGRSVGNTPQMNITLPAGSHRVELVNPQFNVRETLTVQISAGETTRRVVRLQIP